MTKHNDLFNKDNNNIIFKNSINTNNGPKNLKNQILKSISKVIEDDKRNGNLYNKN